MKKKITIFNDKKTWKYIIIISVLFTITELTWYDSIGRIGSGKTSLLNLPLESVLIIIFAWFVLGERLRQFQIIGATIAIIGFTISASSDTNLKTLPEFGIGEMETVIASLSGAIAITLIAKLLVKQDVVQVTAFTLLISGIMLNIIHWLWYGPIIVDLSDWFYLWMFAFVPFLVFLLYYVSIKRIGTSITSIITSTSIVLTVAVQLILSIQTNIPVNPPDNVILAFVGGGISVCGIYMIFSGAKNEKTKKS